MRAAGRSELLPTARRPRRHRDPRPAWPTSLAAASPDGQGCRSILTCCVTVRIGEAVASPRMPCACRGRPGRFGRGVAVRAASLAAHRRAPPLEAQLRGREADPGPLHPVSEEDRRDLRVRTSRRVRPVRRADRPLDSARPGRPGQLRPENPCPRRGAGRMGDEVLRIGRQPAAEEQLPASIEEAAPVRDDTDRRIRGGV